MKAYFIFLCLLIGGGLVFATSQTTLNQDKSARLYVKSYIESATGNINIAENGADYFYTKRQNNRIDTFSENIKYQDGLTGSAQYQGNENYNGSDATAKGASQFQDLCNKTIGVSSGSGINYSAVPTTQITSGSDSSSGSGWDIYGNLSETVGNDVYSSTNNGYGMPGVRSEHCDVGIPIRDHSGIPGFYTYGKIIPPNWQEKYKRKAQTTWKLQTGGKATSKLRNLFALSASATKISPVSVNDGRGVYFSFFDYANFYDGNFFSSGYVNVQSFYAPFDNPAASVVGSTQPTRISISAQNIAIGSCGNLLANGVVYKVLPDNADVDVTPYVAGVDYYTFDLDQPQKYHSYFEVFVNQPTPGTQITISDYNGHAFWQFKTDAPADALQYIEPSLTCFVNTSWGFYPHGADCGLPGQLQNDSLGTGNHGAGHSYSVKRVFYIGLNDLISGLQFARGISNGGVIPRGRSLPPANAIMVIMPYRYAGTWVFDDSKVGLVREPFVAGVPGMIDDIVAGIPDATNGFRLTFSARSFPGYQKKLVWLRGDSDGNYYNLDGTDKQGWICPAMFHYYQTAPKELYVKAEPKT